MMRGGSSSDALRSLEILLEMKARAENCSDPLESLDKYFVQCKLQMICTDAEFYILQWHHWETSAQRFFIWSIKYIKLH